MKTFFLHKKYFAPKKNGVRLGLKRNKLTNEPMLNKKNLLADKKKGLRRTHCLNQKINKLEKKESYFGNVFHPTKLFAAYALVPVFFKLQKDWKPH